ncbi:MAG: hypothetical protein M3M96_06240, partial [Candidatus Eremiobacteraeota bacterium]|nr:hypothetical protein [Candidatus Eremiobacteraeota bacterium]
AGGHLGAFASAADARFLTGSSLQPRNVVMWLQLRNSAGIVLRFFYLIVLYNMVFNRAGSFFGMTLTMAAGAAFCTTLAIPTLAATRRFGKTAVDYFAGAVLVASGFVIATLAIGFLRVPGIPSAPSARVIGLHLGSLLNSMLAGSIVPLAFLLLATVTMVGAAYVCAQDLYPELYASSLESFQRTTRMRKRGRGDSTLSYAVPVAVPANVPLSGAWILLWKEWVEFRRRKLLGLNLSVAAFFWVAAGIAGFFVARNRLADAALYAAFGMSFNLIVVFNMASAVSLAQDLRKPLWWLGSDGLRFRLGVWVLATSWRLGVGLVFAAAIFCLASNRLSAFVLLLPAAAILPFILRAVSLATYAVLPAPADQRGPLALARLFMIYALLAPPVIGFFVVQMTLRNAVAGTLAAVLVATAQIFALVSFAAWRLNGDGAAFALAERS